MAASPLYSMRTQRALAFGNADVPTIFKNIQLDIGAPHQFMDFQYKVDDAQHGEFWLDHCGALMDVEPMGEEFVHGMCHDIEDPTFDATAGATNPYAKVRPIHRPPRVPCRPRAALPLARRHRPDDGEPVGPAPDDGDRRHSRRSRASRIDDPGRDAEPGGWYDYSGEFDPGFTLEDLSHRALVVVAPGSRGANASARARVPALRREPLGRRRSARPTRRRCSRVPPVSPPGRLPAVLGITGDDAEAIAKLLQLHPVFQPRTYVAPRIEVIDERTFASRSPTLRASTSATDLSWFASMQRRTAPALDAIVQAVNPRAFSTPDRCLAPANALAWLITIDPDAAAGPPLAQRGARPDLDRRDREVSPAA